MKQKLHPVQFKKTLWELLVDAAAKETIIQKTSITPAEYVRQVISRHLKRRPKALRKGAKK